MSLIAARRPRAPPPRIRRSNVRDERFTVITPCSVHGGRRTDLISRALRRESNFSLVNGPFFVSMGQAAATSFAPRGEKFRFSQHASRAPTY